VSEEGAAVEEPHPQPLLDHPPEGEAVPLHQRLDRGDGGAMVDVGLQLGEQIVVAERRRRTRSKAS
jgi:hypothetical protein